MPNGTDYAGRRTEDGCGEDYVTHRKDYAGKREMIGEDYFVNLA